MDALEIITLRLQCPTCGRRMTLAYHPEPGWKEMAHAYPCAYENCDRTRAYYVTLSGWIVEWWAGHGRQPADDGEPAN